MKKFVFCLFFLVSLVMAAQAEVLIIANKTMTQAVIDRQDVKDIFLCNRLYWNDTLRISVATLIEGDTAKSFFTTYLGMSAKQFNGHWDEKLYTGGKPHPKRFKTQKQLVEFVAQTPGAIGFIDSGVSHDSVAVVEVKP